MGYSDRRLDNPINWSFRVARVFGIDVRVHIVFVLCALVLISMELPNATQGETWSPGGILGGALGTYALLFAVVLLHEFGHCYGARISGGDPEEILIWPLGGLASLNLPRNPRAHMIATVAGPMVNVAICAIVSTILVAWTGRLGAVPWNPLHPSWPVDPSVYPTTAQWWLMRLFAVSYVILLFNLLPIYPFDGGRILQAWFWPRRGYLPSMALATMTGMIGSIALGIFALFTGEEVLLVMIAVFGYLQCWQVRRSLQGSSPWGGGAYGGELDDTYGLFGGEGPEPGRRPGFFERRRARRAQRRAEDQARRQRERGAEIERILSKVSLSGLGSLTARERRLLEDETQRKRTGA
jgi:Zn-dependent protease